MKVMGCPGCTVPPWQLFFPAPLKASHKWQWGVWYDDKWLNPVAELLTGTKMWGQNSCGTRVEWKLFYTLIAPRPPTRFCLGSPVLSVTEHRWTLQHSLSAPIIKAHWDCQDNAPHNNKQRRFKRLKQQGLVTLLNCSVPATGIACLASHLRRQLQTLCLWREYANVRRWSLWSRTTPLWDGTISDGKLKSGRKEFAKYLWNKSENNETCVSGRSRL